ncbi:MAG TPA: hypothetical protein VJX72_10275 [Candidatus Acidoferrum sp.]|jgi:hypothetical protein|nr:hypothetical protein [Candidatus Acidoferrum sp.]
MGETRRASARACSDDGGVVWADLHVNAYYWFATMPGSVKAVIAQTQTELVLALGVKAAMAFEAGGVF